MDPERYKSEGAGSGFNIRGIRGCRYLLTISAATRERKFFRAFRH
jgi:hypothetical protein